MRFSLALTLLSAASALVLPHAPAVAPRAPPRAASPEMLGVLDRLTELLFPDSKSGTSSTAVSRLKLVLANDRTGVDEATMRQIRSEIQDVVTKYLAIDEEGVNFDVMTDDRLTLLTATFPILSQTKGGGKVRALQMDVATNDG